MSNLSPIEALEQIDTLIENSNMGDNCALLLNEISKIATEALAYKGQDDTVKKAIELLKDFWHDARPHLNGHRTTMKKFFEAIGNLETFDQSYKAGEDLGKAEAIKEMDRSTNALYLELPESIANDVKRIWNNVKNNL